MKVFIVKTDHSLELFETREKAVQYITDLVEKMDCTLEEDDYGFYAIYSNGWCSDSYCKEEFYLIEKEVK